MSSTIRLGLAWVVVGAVVGGAAEASAQVLGTFRWQLAPFCNVVTLRVEQKGALYELSGTEDLCGAPQAASANGSAHVNLNGTASISLTAIRPDGIPISSSAAISLTTLSGTWSDEYGNGGALTFNPPAAPGSPRPVTLRGDYGLAFTAAGAGGSSSTYTFSYGRMLATAPLVPFANIIPAGGASTPNCPGSAANPQASPGQLCIYEVRRQNVSSLLILSLTGFENLAEKTGATVYIHSNAAGLSFAFGRWAVTIP